MVAEASDGFRPEAFVFPFGNALVQCHGVPRLPRLKRVALPLREFLEKR
jgi:hypothetical protein